MLELRYSFICSSIVMSICISFICTFPHHGTTVYLAALIWLLKKVKFSVSIQDQYNIAWSLSKLPLLLCMVYLHTHKQNGSMASDSTAENEKTGSILQKCSLVENTGRNIYFNISCLFYFLLQIRMVNEILSFFQVVFH